MPVERRRRQEVRLSLLEHEDNTTSLDLRAIGGEDVEDTSVELVSLDQAAEFADARDTLNTVNTAAINVSVNELVLYMDNQGRLLRNGAGNTLQRSSDEGVTWETLWTAPRAITGIRQLSSGELLVGISDDFPTNTVKAQVMLSSGYAADTALSFTTKITADDYQQALSLGWGFGGANGIYVVSEYDSKAPGSRSTVQRVWLTQDNFATVTPIYNHGNGSLSNRHIHGAVYDPYRDAIWVTLGDYLDGDPAGARSIIVSWNRGSTWTTVSTDFQPTAIHVFPDCVIFGQDNAPNGVLRMVRPSPTNLQLEVAYRLNNYILPATSRPGLTHVAESPFRSPSPGHPLLIPFTVAKTGEYGLVLATKDGYSFTEIWRSPSTYTETSRGAIRAIGPTPGGKYFISGRGEGSTWFKAEVTAPKPGLTAVGESIAKTLTRAIPRRAFIAIANQFPSYQSVPQNTWTELLLATTVPPFVEDDPGGLFTPSPDGLGVIVNRTCLVRINVDTGLDLSTGPRTGVAVNGVRQANNVGSFTSRSLWVLAGQRISGMGIHTGGSAYTVTGSSYALALEAWETW